ncbi:DNA mismatch repair protein MutT [Paenibacillus sp. FSL H8-0548]|nr:DNA mismatch repair protein MutT [Paenibacillus sp. FSL H8-0548]
MKKVRVVGAVIINSEKKVLCAQRSENMSQPLLWEFPGGKIEKTETASEALIREIKEELDCDIQVGELLTDIMHEYTNIIVNLITYRAKIISGQPVAKEHADLIWLSINELPMLNWAPADIPTLNILINE